MTFAPSSHRLGQMSSQYGSLVTPNAPAHASSQYLLTTLSITTTTPGRQPRSCPECRASRERSIELATPLFLRRASSVASPCTRLHPTRRAMGSHLWLLTQRTAASQPQRSTIPTRKKRLRHSVSKRRRMSRLVMYLIGRLPRTQGGNSLSPRSGFNAPKSVVTKMSRMRRSAKNCGDGCMKRCVLRDRRREFMSLTIRTRTLYATIMATFL